MKKQRERLIEFLTDTHHRWVDEEYEHDTGKSLVEYVADHLLAEGVILPPCKVGQTVWFISKFYKQPFQTVVTSIAVYEEEPVIWTLSGTIWHCEDFGKTVFLTIEEAEKALAEGRKR